MPVRRLDRVEFGTFVPGTAGMVSHFWIAASAASLLSGLCVGMLYLAHSGGA